MDIKISPSMLASDFANLESELKKCETGGAAEFVYSFFYSFALHLQIFVIIKTNLVHIPSPKYHKIKNGCTTDTTVCTYILYLKDNDKSIENYSLKSVSIIFGQSLGEYCQ